MFTPRKMRRVAARSCAVWGFLLLAGCGGAVVTEAPDTSRVSPRPPASTPSRVAAVKAEPGPMPVPRPRSPKPDATRLRYDTTTRTLEVYEPPVPGGRWMLATPTEPRGVPVEKLYQFPPMVDLDQFAVYYTGLNGQHSQPVSLREIVEARDFQPR